MATLAAASREADVEFASLARALAHPARVWILWLVLGRHACD